MAQILIEVHLLEAKINKRSTGRDSLQEVFDHYEAMMFDSLGLDTVAYNESIRYYIDHPTQMAEIYAVVVDSLQVRSKNLGMK